jgi:hypothetical protein
MWDPLHIGPHTGTPNGDLYRGHPTGDPTVDPHRGPAHGTIISDPFRRSSQWTPYWETPTGVPLQGIHTGVPHPISDPNRGPPKVDTPLVTPYRESRYRGPHYRGQKQGTLFMGPPTVDP